MKDRKNAMKMLTMAKKDFKALSNMKDETIFDTEIFGFHAQQTVEKLLKAWLSEIGIKYEKTHDLLLLFTLLEDNNIEIPLEFIPLNDLTNFAVNFRYDPLEESDAVLDREDIINRINVLLKSVEKEISG